VVLHGGEHAHRSGDVVAVVFEGVGDALSHQGEGGEVDDPVNGELREQPVQEGPVPHIPHPELGPLHRLPVAGAEVVRHHHVIAPLHQQGHHVAADIAGAAGHQNGLHQTDLPSAKNACFLLTDVIAGIKRRCGIF